MAGKQQMSQVERLMADIRSKVAAIGSEAARADEGCIAFSRKEAEYAEWLQTHSHTGYVLDRDSGTSKTARLHAATCVVIGGKGSEEGEKFTQQPKVGCPSKTAAITFAKAKKWKMIDSCEHCTE